MRNLLSIPSASMQQDLALVLRAIQTVLPLSHKHRRLLPEGVQELSRILTTERDSRQAYWAAPRLLSAYLYYFLPWNLQRLACLLPGMDFNLKPEARILDLGSGPLTLPLGLWIARPELRSLPLHFTVTDLALHPLSLGVDIFRAVAGPQTPWTFSQERLSLENALGMTAGRSKSYGTKHGQAQGVAKNVYYDLILAGNVLNEVPAPRKGNLAGRLRQLAQATRRRLKPEGRVFLLEPGTRLGGKLISLFRAGALQNGLVPLAPCPHWGFCPALPQGSWSRSVVEQGNLASRFSGWCHFSYYIRQASEQVPAELLELSAEAELMKSALHLSCLLLRKALPEEMPLLEGLGVLDIPDDEDEEEFGAAGDKRDHYDPEDDEYPAGQSGRGAASVKSLKPRRSVLRIISDPISLPARGISARYACSERGLALLLNGAVLPSGAAVEEGWPEVDQRDAKSGALEISFSGYKAVAESRPDAHIDAKPQRAALPRKPARSGGNVAPERLAGEPAHKNAAPDGETLKKGRALQPGKEKKHARTPASQTGMNDPAKKPGRSSGQTEHPVRKKRSRQQAARKGSAKHE